MRSRGEHEEGRRYVLPVVEGATENTVLINAVLDNLIDKGLDPTLPGLFIIDGANAL